jgi:hypothetical protein
VDRLQHDAIDHPSMKSQAGSSGNHPATADPNSGCVPARDGAFMQCANSSCSKDLLYLREGRLELVELDPASDDQAQPDGGAFAMNSLPSKFFWLCGDCAHTHIIKRWTTAGLVLASRKRHRPDIAEAPMRSTEAPPEGCMPPTRQPAFYEVKRPPRPADSPVLFHVASGSL